MLRGAGIFGPAFSGNRANRDLNVDKYNIHQYTWRDCVYKFTCICTQCVDIYILNSKIMASRISGSRLSCQSIQVFATFAWGLLRWMFIVIICYYNIDFCYGVNGPNLKRATRALSRLVFALSSGPRLKNDGVWVWCTPPTERCFPCLELNHPI